MRRSASEFIRNLEQRIAHLEGKTANKNAGLKIESNWYTGSPRQDVRMMTLIDIVGEILSINKVALWKILRKGTLNEVLTLVS